MAITGEFVFWKRLKKWLLTQKKLLNSLKAHSRALDNFWQLKAL